MTTLPDVAEVLTVGDPLPDFVRFELGRDAVEGPLLVTLVPDRVAQRALLVGEEFLARRDLCVLRRRGRCQAHPQRQSRNHSEHEHSLR